MISKIKSIIKNRLFSSPSKKLFLKLYNQKIKKINVGANSNVYDGWLQTDIDTLNITVEKNWKDVLLYLKLDNIMSEHVWEHLPENDIALANKNCYKFLKKGGVLRIAVPDGFNPDKEYIEYVKPGGHGYGSDDHKTLFNYKLMTQQLQAVGFKVNLLEYWDENGKFHSVDWTDEAGHIKRSRRYDHRNQDGKLGYTSLIVDAIKL